MIFHQALFSMSNKTLKAIVPYWPQLQHEGINNLWMVKPAAEFCGRGIKLVRTVAEIFKSLEASEDNKISQHIVQKYIGNGCWIVSTVKALFYSVQYPGLSSVGSVITAMPRQEAQLSQN